ncbi:odorant receptor 67d-like isoform X2 [Musca domestica]|uniref:Odorant receptor n=1 Tax=Musca domestica TaxID=7370 RepID=A0ABM3V7W2_MUSDO|nr:odorant receptor 67d-like isoform X2 [Musca domestica]
MNLEDSRNANKLHRPSNRLRKIVRITRICSYICGADVFDPNYCVNIRTYFVLAVINFSILLLSYTMYSGWVEEGDWAIVLQVLTIGGGTLLQGYCKLINSIRQKDKFRFLLTEVYSIFEEYELKSCDYARHLKKGCHLLSYFMKLCAVINVMMICGLILVAAAINVIFQKRDLIVYGDVIGIDPSTTSGFYVTFMVQACFLLVGGFGLYAGDMAFFTPISQVPTLKEILRCKFKDINEAMEGDELQDSRHVSELLKDAVQFHQKYLRFLNTTQDTYYWVILTQISTYSVGIVCSMFCIFLGTWPGGYIYLLYCFVMMFVYCGVGTMVDIAQTIPADLYVNVKNMPINIGSCQTEIIFRANISFNSHLLAIGCQPTAYIIGVTQTIALDINVVD